MKNNYKKEGNKMNDMNIVSMVLSIMEFNKNIISRDRVFVYIAILTFNFFMLLTYLF